jgi:hypothetical protein
MPLEVANVTSEHIEAFMADQQARLRPSSARVRYASLVQFGAVAVAASGELAKTPMWHHERSHREPTGNP